MDKINGGSLFTAAILGAAFLGYGRGLAKRERSLEEKIAKLGADRNQFNDLEKTALNTIVAHRKRLEERESALLVKEEALQSKEANVAKYDSFLMGKEQEYRDARVSFSEYRDRLEAIKEDLQVRERNLRGQEDAACAKDTAELEQRELLVYIGYEKLEAERRKFETEKMMLVQREETVAMLYEQMFGEANA